MFFFNSLPYYKATKKAKTILNWNRNSLVSQKWIMVASLRLDAIFLLVYVFLLWMMIQHGLRSLKRCLRSVIMKVCFFVCLIQHTAASFCYVLIKLHAVLSW